jgi:Ca2+-transporting ATPase
MERPPRSTRERLFDARSVALGIALGVGVLLAVALVFGLALGAGRAEGEARALAFTALVAGNLSLIFANRSATLTLLQLARHENPAVWWILAGTTAALAAVLFVPTAAELFRFVPPAPGEAILAAAAGFASVLWYDAAKRLRRV